jgi:hypothetical protein
MHNVLEKPQIHWSKPIFQEHQIPLGAVAKAIDRNYFYTSKILNGDVSATPEVEDMLARIATQLEDA